MSVSNVRDTREEVARLKMDIANAQAEARLLEYALLRGLSLTRKLTGGSESLDDAISKAQKALMTIRLLHSSYLAFEASTGPLGLALAGISLITGLISAGEFAMEMS